MSFDFSSLIAMRYNEFSLLCDYLGKEEANAILQKSIDELDSISAVPIKFLSDIQSPDEYAFIVGKLVESRKAYKLRHQALSANLKLVLNQLSEQIGKETVSDRIKNWLARYNKATDKDCKKIYEVMEIAKLEALLQQVTALLKTNIAA